MLILHHDYQPKKNLYAFDAIGHTKAQTLVYSKKSKTFKV